MRHPISPFFAAFSLSICFLPLYIYANFMPLIEVIFLIISTIFGYISLICLLYIIAVYLHQKTADISQPYRTALSLVIYLFIIILILAAVYIIDPPSLSLITNGALPLLIMALISYFLLTKLQKKPNIRFKLVIWLILTLLIGTLTGIITGTFLVIFESADARIIITFLLMFGAVGFITSLIACFTLFTSVKIITSFLPKTLKIF